MCQIIFIKTYFYQNCQLDNIFRIIVIFDNTKFDNITTNNIINSKYFVKKKEEWNAPQERWCLKKIEYIFEDPAYPVPSND